MPNDGQGEYGAECIKVLEGLEPVRKRPTGFIAGNPEGIDPLQAFGVLADELYPHEPMARLRSREATGWTDLGEALRDAEIALGGFPTSDVPPAERIAACQVAIEHAFALMLGGEGWDLTLSTEDAQWLETALDGMSASLAAQAPAGP